jgi:uncharacterized protein YraI
MSERLMHGTDGPVYRFAVMMRALLISILLAFSVSAEAKQAVSKSAANEVPYLKVTGIRFGNVLWVRSGPGKKYRRIGFLPHNARHIRNFGCSGPPRREWCHISYRGTRAWASKRYLVRDTVRRASL